ncbi:hypothetical protein M0802_005940 [Mischocyttarus mexicanus]|nr:hypothetical protein M0802_005940 [Mischocyttarus mexicanus]
MEDSFRIIYALCIIFIRFPLYYLAPVQNNFYMYNDTNLCNNSMKDFLYKSKYTKECNSLKYDEELDKINDNNIKQFLCLGINDAMYKVCQYKDIEQWNQHFPDQNSFDILVEDLMKIYRTDGSNKTSKDFCNDLTGYTPKYDKLKPVLSLLAVELNRQEICFSICFDLESKLKTPLCAILVWINKIDQEITDKSNKVKINNVDLKEENLKVKKINYKNQSKIQDDTNNPKVLENKRKENRIQNEEKLVVSNILANNENKSNTNNTNNNNNNNSNQVEQLPLSKESSTDINDQSNPVVKSESVVKTTPQSTSNPKMDNIKETNDKATSPLKEADEKLSQEPLPIIEEDDSQSKKKDKVDLEKSLLTDDKFVNQPVTETKSTEVINNVKTITTTESNIVVDSISGESDNLNNVPTTEDVDQLAGIDNPSESMSEPSEQRAHFENDEESHFLFYFAVISIGFIGGYTGYHNKKKLLAIVLKGRRSKNNRGRRRSSSPKYRKLDCTLEEAVTSQCNANVTHVIY